MNRTGYEKASLAFGKEKEHFKPLGRARFLPDGLLCDWPAAGVEFLLDCEGTLAVTADVAEKRYFRCFVDGKDCGRVPASPGDERLTLAEDLRAGTHRIRILHDGDMTILHGSRTVLRALEVSCKAETLSAAPQKKHLIEFIGDSITSGMGTLLDDRKDDCSYLHWAPAIHSAVASYAYGAAEELDADYSLVSKGGIGIVKEREALDMRRLYPTWNGYFDPNDAYDFPRTPDVIVNALGTNDASDDKFCAEMVAFSEMLREKHGKDCKIVFFYNMMTSRQNERIEAVVQQLGGSAAGFYPCRAVLGTHGGRATEVSPCGHPSAADDTVNAALLASFLRPLLG